MTLSKSPLAPKRRVRHNGHMTPKQLEAARLELGFTITGFAKFLGVDRRSYQRWHKGEARIPVPVMLLVKIFQAAPWAMEYVKK